ncbi:Sn1-specific diacylglycerol lipase alpha [Trichophyton mentagrophytes]|nr:Sn1-specific diacylglycerol lipase alpha [Trichophyton mentagrophytes]
MPGHDHPDQASATSVTKWRKTRGGRPSSNTLLPSPVASLVSLVTQSTSLSLRLWTYLGGFVINSARATTLTGLELSRAVVEGILIRAGRDVVSRSSDEHGRSEAESLLERSLATLHTTITSAAFFASASFHLSTVTLSSVTSFSQTLLSTLDAILGSTESSRAIASIITLIRREFRNPEVIPLGETVGVGDLLVGSIGFVLLQRWGRRQTDKEIRQNGNEETIWDVVILDNGLRADVVGTHQTAFGEDMDGGDSSSLRPSSFLIPDTSGNESLDTLGRGNRSFGHLVPHVSLHADCQHDRGDDEIRRYIAEQLPRGCHATIKVDTATARTITVDVFDSGHVNISPPPGTTKIEERVQPEYNNAIIGSELVGESLPKHTVIFRTVSNSFQESELRMPSQVTTPDTQYGWSQTDIRENTPNDDARFTQSASIETSPRMRPSRTHRRRRTSASDTSGSETPRTVGTRSFARITSKVKANAEEKPGNNLSKKLSKGASTAAQSNPSVSPFHEPRSGHKRGLKKVLSSSKEREKSNASTVKNKTVMSDSTNRIRPLSPKKEKSTPRKVEREASSHEANSGNQLASSRYLLREKGPESFTHTDPYSIRSPETQPSSPSFPREHIRSNSSLSKARSEKDMSLFHNFTSRPGTPMMSRRNSSKSAVPSLYSIATGSETSLLLAPRTGKSAYDDNSALSSLSRTGYVPGLYPSNNLVRNIRRFSRFSSASYGSNFLRIMGISNATTQLRYEDPVDHHEHNSFSDYTGLPASTILLSSFVDTAGGTNSAGVNSEGFPLVHYLSIDHESKAAVLTLRGTWGFEDILTDMTCDYDDMIWLGRTYQVHKGMLASARRLLEGGGGKVMATLKSALEEFPDYGVIFCGHSLGGGVAALLATLMSQPQHPDLPGPSFVTSSSQQVFTGLLPATAHEATQSTHQQMGQFSLPPGRPVHVYAYGPPAVMSPSLRLATRGLITTIVNGHDVVPTLSLGVLHDFHSVALSFKRDVADAKSQVKARVWDAITRSIANKLNMDNPSSIHAGDGLGEDSWAWNTLKSLREGLTATKLLPPGEVFVVETMRVLQRDAFSGDMVAGDGYPRLGRPATRVQLKYIRDVEKRFREVKFGSGMLLDHSPARYESSLAILARGVLEDE